MFKFNSFKSLLILNGFAIFLTLLAIFLKGIIIFSPVPSAITPANPKTTEKSLKLEETESSVQTKDSDNQSVILSANKETSEEYEGEITQVFSVNESFSADGLNVTIKNITLAILSKENMEEMGMFGDGLLDVTFEVKNQSQTDVQIYPSLLKFTVNKESYPVNSNPVLRDGNIAAGETVSGNVIAPVYTLSAPEDVKEFSFNWKTTQNKISNSAEVVVILKE
ncbi:hypothetical protein ACWN8V_11355 [Vagococcus elongatus]|uniref:DUF4352 domain-containing protein n=1 Tax=Vagococcus elongatus TaxID=180344 RepID=A0A430AMW9_9ENTE|nr:hypothetical protein [Vagococcus elongatus]RSU09461.1 hypothetical protein CBF29_11475 [Vagococcus elongatus]